MVDPSRSAACYPDTRVGRCSFSVVVLALFAACGGESVYTEGGAGGDAGSSGGSKGGSGGKGGRGGRGGTGGETGGVGGASGGTGGTTGGTGGTGGATGGTGGASGGTGGTTGGTGGTTGGTGGTTGGTGGATGGTGGRTGGTGGVGGATGGTGGRAGGTGGVGGATGGAGGASGGTGGVIVCPPGFSNCGDVCVDLSSNRRHCGSCGAACVPGEQCEDGQCELSCREGLTDCFGLCVDTETDRRFCGFCDRFCGVGQACEGGECVTRCPAPLVDCGGVCTSLEFDPSHCGACGNQCPGLPNAEPTCVGGGCSVECSDGYKDCNNVLLDGCEADLASDSQNCGACGNACQPGLACVNGSCPMGTYQWRLVTTHACNAWCSQAPAPFDTCGDPWACGPGTIGGLIWIYQGGPTPPPNPASSDTQGYGWVHWYCDRNGCDGPGPSSGSCNGGYDNYIYECVFE
jgi:hypothetical protein